MKTHVLASIAVAALVISARPACAHAFLTTASPAVGSSVSTPPSEVVINFTEGVEPLFSTIVVADAAGRHVETGRPHLVGGDAHLAVALKPLTPGIYKVMWHATATDTHKTQGSFSFTVK